MATHRNSQNSYITSIISHHNNQIINNFVIYDMNYKMNYEMNCETG